MRKYQYRLKWLKVQFEFDSIGPRGVIKKIVDYQTRVFRDEEMVNLGLGDWNEQGLYADDRITSNNRDTNMVLATVASTCLNMIELHPSIQLLAEGNTPARNRLYRIGILKNWKEIEMLLDIEGLRSGKWEPFQPSMTYDAFRAKRRQK